MSVLVFIFCLFEVTLVVMPLKPPTQFEVIDQDCVSSNLMRVRWYTWLVHEQLSIRRATHGWYPLLTNVD